MADLEMMDDSARLADASSGQQMPEQKAISTFFIVNQVPGWRIAAAQTTAVNADIITKLPVG